MFLCFMCKCKRWCFDDYQRRRCVCLPLFIAARLPSRSILGARWRSHLLKAPCVPHIVCLCGRKTQCDHNYTHQWNIIIFIILCLCVHKTQCAHDHTHQWKLRSFATANIRHGKHHNIRWVSAVASLKSDARVKNAKKFSYMEP